MNMTFIWQHSARGLCQIGVLEPVGGESAWYTPPAFITAKKDGQVQFIMD